MSEPPAAPTRASSAWGAYWPVLLGCLVLGLAEWSWFVVGRINDRATGNFLLVALATALVVGVTFEGSAIGIAFATFAGAFATASWTTPRGDNDGLWGLIFPMIIVVALIGAALIAAARRVLRAQRWQRVTRAFVVSHRAIGVGVVLVAAAASMMPLLGRRPDPYPGLERAVATFPAPASFVATGTSRAGDPLCDTSCFATVEADYTSSQPAQATCKTIATVLAKWRDTTVRTSEPVFAPVICSWDLVHAGIDGSMEVSDEPGGAVLRLTLFDPRRRNRGIFYQL